MSLRLREKARYTCSISMLLSTVEYIIRGKKKAEKGEVEIN